MGQQTFQGLDAGEQLAELEAVATDPRPRAASGFGALDAMLNRGSFGAAELVILGGRMHTRKTGVMVNLIVNMLHNGVPVGLVGLDESPAMYVAKLMSVQSGLPHTELTESFGSARTAKARERYRNMVADNLSVTKGYRPTFDHLSGWLKVSDQTGKRPRVVFIDYLSLMTREKYAKGPADRVQRLIEDLQVWTNDEEVTTIVLHQVGRSDDTSKRYHGDSPMTPEQLMYGGEQAADIILSTFRPALEPIGNMTLGQAKADGVDEDEWNERRAEVEKTADLTFLQLTKNRPGTKLLYRGIPLRSHGESQRMAPIEDSLDAEGKLTEGANDGIER